MTTPARAALPIAILALAVTSCGSAEPPPAGSTSSDGPAKPVFSKPARITNPYLPISKLPHCTLVGTGDDAGSQVVRTVQDRTKRFRVNGAPVDAMVVEDRETDKGEPVELTYDYFAQDDAGTVYYLGEDVDTYKNGKVDGHEGAWLYGEDSQTLTPIMPADPRVGDEWKSEDVPGVTVEEDRAVKAPDSANSQGKTYTDLLRVREYSLPDKDVEFKLYSKGTGVITEENGALELKSCS